MHQPSKNNSTCVVFLFVCIILQKEERLFHALLYYSNELLLPSSSGYSWLMAFRTKE